MGCAKAVSAEDARAWEVAVSSAMHPNRRPPSSADWGFPAGICARQPGRIRGGKSGAGKICCIYGILMVNAVLFYDIFFHIYAQPRGIAEDKHPVFIRDKRFFHQFTPECIIRHIVFHSCAIWYGTA